MESIEEWDVTANRFVAFFDILGFKDLVLNNSHEEVLAKVESLIDSLKVIDAFNNSVDNGDVFKGRIERYVFSDSIILFTADDSMDSAVRIVMATSAIMITALLGEIPLKGALAHGKITVDRQKSLFFGKGIIDSYSLHDELKLFGVVLHHTAEKRLSDLKLLIEPIFLEHKLCPMRDGLIRHYLINWLWVYDFLQKSAYNKEMDLESLNDFLVLIIDDIYFNVSGSSRKYVDNTISSIRLMEKGVLHPNARKISDALQKLIDKFG